MESELRLPLPHSMSMFRTCSNRRLLEFPRRHRGCLEVYRLHLANPLLHWTPLNNNLLQQQHLSSIRPPTIQTLLHDPPTMIFRNSTHRLLPNNLSLIHQVPKNSPSLSLRRRKCSPWQEKSKPTI